MATLAVHSQVVFFPLLLLAILNYKSGIIVSPFLLLFIPLHMSKFLLEGLLSLVASVTPLTVHSPVDHPLRGTTTVTVVTAFALLMSTISMTLSCTEQPQFTATVTVFQFHHQFAAHPHCMPLSLFKRGHRQGGREARATSLVTLVRTMQRLVRPVQGRSRAVPLQPSRLLSKGLISPR